MEKKVLQLFTDIKDIGFVDGHTLFKKSDSVQLNKNDTPKILECFKNQEIKSEYKWQKNDVEDCNKSTLSLHIAAYENATENQKVNRFYKVTKKQHN